ncbi:MAG: transketolase family protein [Leptotrichiaceae bacterium]|nr:transketolase family protein [Leptotrichiaceae bacterium]MBP6281009.1 transketolase family protein [Leptotrichiaceae bacterium]MBP7100394.1 transketolase family protein [Leptotrichiaceae bacterium]MBP7725003.1 transketolase family protein [Leptotrichiaceae bacterium]MBP9629634.1 transketolase family protein [Leptotrichiaceae bacterium]
MEKKSTRQAYGEALVKLGKENKDVIVLEADLSKSTMTAYFQKEFPERHINVGIAEADMMGTAAGFATTGKIPFASTFAHFAAGRAFDQIRNSIAYPRLNVKICPTHAGVSLGEDGGSHQSVEDIALMRSIPGMLVLSPADAVETEKMILAVAKYEGPVYVRLGRLNIPVIFDDSYTFEIGKAVTLKEGNDVAIFATGLMVYEALEGAKLLEQEGINARVINVSTIKPLDEETVLKAAKECKFIVTSEEHSIIGGLGSAISEYLSGVYPTKVIRHGINDEFGQSADGETMLNNYKLRAKDIAETVLKNK